MERNGKSRMFFGKDTIIQLHLKYLSRRYFRKYFKNCHRMLSF